jgi:hypothetical protein
MREEKMKGEVARIREGECDFSHQTKAALGNPRQNLSHIH